MHSARDLLQALHSKGVQIWVEDGQIRFQASKGTLLPADRESLLRLKVEVLGLLEQAPCACDAPLEPRLAGCPIPLTAVQLRCWKYLNEHKELSWRMCVIAARIFGPLDVSLLQSSVDAIVRRHESLRTRFVSVDGAPRQHVDPPCKSELELIDLSKVPPADIEAHVRCQAEEFVEEKIDLSLGPLFSGKLFKLSHCEHVLVLAMDHMISDGTSTGILSRELWTLYQQAAQGLPFSLPHLCVQFADYAVWQHQTHAAWLQKHEAYWRRRLGGAPKPNLPISDRLRTVENPLGVRRDVPFGGALSHRLRDAARREQTFLAIVVLTIYVAALSRWCNQRDLLVLFVSSGRNRPELSSMIGFLAEDIRLRIEMDEKDRFLDLLQRIKLELYAAYDHQDFGRVPDIIPECTTDAYFNWVSPSWGAAHLVERNDSKVRIESFSLFRKPLPFTFGSFFVDSPAGITWSVEYRPDLFTGSEIERFGRNLRSFADAIVQRPFARVASIPFEV